MPDVKCAAFPSLGASSVHNCLCLSHPDRQNVDLLCILFHHSCWFGFNWPFLSCCFFFPHSVSPLPFPLSFILFYLCPSFSPCFPCCLLSNLSLFLFMALCLCRVLGMNGIASIWKCSGDDIEHMWPWLTGQALCGDHTVSLVAGRRNKKGMYNYFKQGRHCERRERSGDGVGCIVSCRSWVCVFVCVRTTYLVTSQQSFQLNGSRKAR